MLACRKNSRNEKVRRTDLHRRNGSDSVRIEHDKVTGRWWHPSGDAKSYRNTPIPKKGHLLLFQTYSAHSITDSETGERGESPDFESVETLHVWRFTCFDVLLDHNYYERERETCLLATPRVGLQTYKVQNTLSLSLSLSLIIQTRRY